MAALRTRGLRQELTVFVKESAPKNIAQVLMTSGPGNNRSPESRVQHLAEVNGRSCHP
jgi:hypothetical protein